MSGRSQLRPDFVLRCIQNNNDPLSHKWPSKFFGLCAEEAHLDVEVYLEVSSIFHSSPSPICQIEFICKNRSLFATSQLQNYPLENNSFRPLAVNRSVFVKTVPGNVSRPHHHWVQLLISCLVHSFFLGRCRLTLGHVFSWHHSPSPSSLADVS